MNLKEDFLEALNSVKKDIFNGSGDAEDSRQARPAEFAPPAYAPENAAGAKESDESVFDAFEQASAIDDSFYPESTDDNAPAGADYPAVPTFRSYDPGASGVTFAPAAPAAPPSPAIAPAMTSYRQDFDRTDLYSDDKTIISKNTVIRGAVQTDDSIRLLGQVHGDIDCKSNIVVAGKVRGNTTAANAYVMDAQIDGNMQCEDVVSVSSDAWVLGNIRAQQAEIDGKIKGNLDIRHAISIGSTSSIIGNISTDELEIKRGAFINGQIMMYTPSRDVLDRFDQFED
jgi:cytoskeletal protein CcmA (bactofilin family)